jgi:Uma2 family endonuclease
MTIHAPPTIRMRAAEYLALPETMQHTELLGGNVIIYAQEDAMPAPQLEHQRIIRRLVRWLSGHIPNGEVFLAPTDLHFDDLNVVQPDVFWAKADGACYAVEGKYMRGAPALVVEVFSPGSVRQDKIAKFKLYEQQRVAEYWMIDPSEQYVEVYGLAGDAYVQVGVFASGGTYTSPVLNEQVVPVVMMFEG